MKYLLDTYVLDWAQNEVERLSPKAHAILRDAKPGDLAVSDVSLTELARHLVSGKIKPGIQPEAWLEAAVVASIRRPPKAPATLSITWAPAACAPPGPGK